MHRNTLLVLAIASVAWLAPASPVQASKRTITLPLSRRSSGHSTHPRGVLGSVIGLGDYADERYTVSVTVGKSTVPLELSTGASDLVVISQACARPACQNLTDRYDTNGSFTPIASDVPVSEQPWPVNYTQLALARVGLDSVSIADLTVANQTLAAVDDINDTSIYNGAAGVFGLGFPSASELEDVMIAAQLNMSIANLSTDALLDHLADWGPTVPRFALSGAIQEPMFAISLQRDTIDISGSGQLTIGQLPPGVDNASLTWVPVRLYNLSVLGFDPPTFAPNELSYPQLWEVELEAIFLDGEQLPASNETVDLPVTALISSNSAYVGSADIISTLLQTVSPAYATHNTTPAPIPCGTPHNLTFQIGGHLFPIDPRDFSAPTSHSTAECTARVGPTGSPPSGHLLYSWILGTPFLKRTLVAFHYGNLTHPSAGPPRVGLRSLVPQNASALLEDAESASGGFRSTSQAAPTSASLITTTSAGNMSSMSAQLTTSAEGTPAPSPSSTSSVNGAIHLQQHGHLPGHSLAAFIVGVALCLNVIRG